MTFFIGVDAGGSHCRARLVDAAGTVLGTGEGGPANAGIGIDALRAVLAATMAQAVAQAGLDAAQLSSVRVGMGIAGIRRPGIRDALAAADFGLGPVAFASDAEIAQLGAHGGEDGAILILGTGSVALLRMGGATEMIGGYGFPISDESSGAALGLSAMRHALRALDGRAHTSALSDAVSARFGDDTAQAVAWMAQASPRDYGALAPLVMDHADAGDPIARSIVEDAAGHVERFIDTIAARGVNRCTLVGGLASRMVPWLRMRNVARLTPPRGDALDGALRLAGFGPPLR
ncbi:BadF/BadG/BcrA/BcrD ATPase family protein [Sphingomonas sp. 2R-10]|uniref:BadF/BadG/BcrA/BcrD ATPase family protein n=1 Tax=Sphingomonas sp. 2R-10 TaxID=3045148 RepID=UPI000F7A35CC|nr:BadF/BadG/BcrA/BcrD ATPase family protein [Sphingomonas sp. 2R-10]MDJ0278327.1 BadF/BadG/BcrA/BcrD ATPase family protein [Sphingomonas sp. 2R-10]